MSDLQKSRQGTQRASNFRVPHRARVINNKDPLKLGRVQVTIQSIMEETSPDKCPWVLRDSLPPGSSPSNKSWEVPEEGTEVEVFTKDGKEDVLYYRGTVESQITQTPQIFDKNYPMTVGTINSIGDVFRIDKTDGELEFYRHLFSLLFKIDREGNIVVHIPGNLVFKANNIYFKADADFGADAGGRLGMKSGANFEIEGGGGDCSLSANGGALGLNGSGGVKASSGVSAGIVGSISSAISSSVSSAKDALTNLASQVAAAMSRDRSNRKRIGKE